ncbi:hypothetical protein SEA_WILLIAMSTRONG_57 [Microbacterium phage WilliamStrong]|nr:hypothetical protein SEA_WILLIAMSTRONG_57 [Microbacterium phage WilliamStrong]
MADVLRCRDTLPHIAHDWGESTFRYGKPVRMYYRCPGYSGMVPALDGATNEPAPDTMIASAGEFAARWNTMEAGQREALWERIRQSNETAVQCFQRDHDALQEQLRASDQRRASARSEIQGLLDSLDSHVTHDEIYSQLRTIQEAL